MKQVDVRNKVQLNTAVPEGAETFLAVLLSLVLSFFVFFFSRRLTLLAKEHKVIY